MKRAVSRIFSAGLALVLAIAVLPVGAGAQPVDTAQTRPGEFIVVFDAGSSRAHERAASHAKAGARVLKRMQIDSRRYELVSVDKNVSLSSVVEAYAGVDDVEWVQPNYIYERAGLPDDPHFASQWGLKNMGQFGGLPGSDVSALAAWQTSTGGSGPVIAVLDDGVNTEHPDLAPNVVAGWDFVDGDSSPRPAAGQATTHGTHVSGIAAARGGNGIGVAGVSWHARIMPVRVIGPNGRGDTATTIQAIQWATARGARIINASFGGLGPARLASTDTALRSAITDSGVLFVAAAGNSASTNDGPGEAFFPAAFDSPNIIAVAATDNWDRLATFSNHGVASVDIAAPGVRIMSTLGGSGYDYMQGTSMAAPFVSGAAALALSVNPSLTTPQLKRVILSSVDKVPGVAGRVSTQGRLNLEKVVANAATPPVARVDRMQGPDRYAAAVDIARRSNPGWEGVTDIVLASGEDRAAADPLAAAGLVWALDGAPILLTRSGAVPPVVIDALAQIAQANPDGVRVHAVGGPAPLPEERLAEIREIAPGVISTPQRVAGENRYATAEAIVDRMRTLKPGEMPARVLVANGADAPKFFDALALSPITAATGAPIVLVTEKTVPEPSRRIINRVAPQRVVVGGGPATVSDGVLARLQSVSGVQPQRWAGANRYETAATIVHRATAAAWLHADTVAVAAGLPDALAGGAMIGRSGGGLLLTERDRVSPATRTWLHNRTGVVDTVWVLGGTAVVSPATQSAIRPLIR